MYVQNLKKNTKQGYVNCDVYLLLAHVINVYV